MTCCSSGDILFWRTSCHTPRYPFTNLATQALPKATQPIDLSLQTMTIALDSYSRTNNLPVYLHPLTSFSMELVTAT